MNSRFPPNEPFDDQERDLARIVRALPGGEPPPALDARILRAAANAAAASRRPRSRWLATASGLWGIGGAAAAVLALGIGWQMMSPMRTQQPAEAPTAAVVADESEELGVTVEFGTRESPKSMPAPPLQTVERPQQRSGMAAAPAPAASPAPPPPPPPAAVPEAFPVTASAAPEVASAHEALAPAPARDAGSAALAARLRDQAAAKRQESERTLAAGDSAGLTARASVDAEPPAISDPVVHPNTPAKWLAEIRRLRELGKTDEARASLVEFRKRHPGYVIPSDLLALLRE